METIAKKVVQNWAAKGYISDDEVEMCLYNLIRHTFTVAVREHPKVCVNLQTDVR